MYHSNAFYFSRSMLFIYFTCSIFNVLPITFPVGPIWKEENYYAVLWRHAQMSMGWYNAVVPNLFGTRDRFRGRQYFHGRGRGNGFRMIQAHYIYCALYFYYYYIVIYNEIIIQFTIMPTGGGAQAVMWAMGSSCKYRWSFARLPATHLLLCGPGAGEPWYEFSEQF